MSQRWVPSQTSTDHINTGTEHSLPPCIPKVHDIVSMGKHANDVEAKQILIQVAKQASC